jgi:hypothetical protein
MVGSMGEEEVGTETQVKRMVEKNGRVLGEKSSEVSYVDGCECVGEWVGVVVGVVVGVWINEFVSVNGCEWLNEFVSVNGCEWLNGSL